MKNNYTYGIVALVVLALIGGYFYTQQTLKVNTYTDPSKTYTLEVPSGWYAHELKDGQVIFTPSQKFDLPKGTESYALGNQMVVRLGSFDEIVGAKSSEDYLRGIGATATSEFFVARSRITTKQGLDMERVVLKAAAADGQTLLYAYFPGDKKVVIFSHYPYFSGSTSASAFESLVNSFKLISRNIESSTPVTITDDSEKVLGGFIRQVNAIGSASILLDDAVWLAGKDAEDAAIAAGRCTHETRSECLPNNYFIQNIDTATHTLPVAENAILLMKTWKAGGAGIQEREISIAEFAALINDQSAHWKDLPYRVTTKGGLVTKIEELYIP